MKKLFLLFVIPLISLSFTMQVDNDGVVKALKTANVEQYQLF
jgi:hypothetical protein